MDIETIKKKSIILISSFSTAFNYMIAGILLTSITFNFGYMAYIQSVFSTVCFYLGLRLIKKINRSFQMAYYISLYILIATTIINLLLMLSPIEISTNIELLNHSLNIVKIILISIGLNKFVIGYQNIVFGCLYVLLQILGILFQSDNIDFMVAIVFLMFIFLIVRNLWECKNEVKKFDNLVKVSSVKIPSSIFMGLWVIIMLVGSIGVNYAWPLLAYHYVDSKQDDYQLYQVINEETDLNLFDKVTIYNFSEDEYMLVYRYQKAFDAKYSILDMKITSSTPRGYIVSGFPPKVYIQDKKGRLETTNIIDTNINPGDILFSDKSDIRRTYLNPFSNDIEIIVEVFVPKRFFNDEVDYIYNLITLGFQNYGKIFNDRNDNLLSENIMINKNGEITGGKR